VTVRNEVAADADRSRRDEGVELHAAAAAKRC